MNIKSVILAASLVVFNANAAEVDVFKVNGQYGQVPYTNDSNGWASGAVSVDGAGVNQTAFLYYSAYSSDMGFKYWRGNIPVEAVTVTGVASISVEIDTCMVTAIAGCGYVNFSVSTNEPASGWINNGVWGYNNNGYIVRYAGASQARSSTSTGTILGQNVDSTRAWMGKMNDVTIEVQTGN